MVEIGIGIGLRTGTKETFTFARAHVRDMFGEVGDTLLWFEFIRRTAEYLEMGLESSGGGTVGEEDVGESVGEDAALDGGVEGEGVGSIAAGEEGLAMGGVEGVEGVDVIAFGGVGFECC